MSHKTFIFVLPETGFKTIVGSKKLSQAFQQGIGKLSERFETLLNTYKMSHLCFFAVNDGTPSACEYEGLKRPRGLPQGPRWLQEAFEPLQTESADLQDVAIVCFGSVLSQNSFSNDVSKKNYLFALSKIGWESS